MVTTGAQNAGYGACDKTHFKCQSASLVRGLTSKGAQASIRVTPLLGEESYQQSKRLQDRLQRQGDSHVCLLLSPHHYSCNPDRKGSSAFIQK